MPRLSPSSADWRNTEKLTRFSATEADSGKDTRQLLADRLDCPVKKIAGSGPNNRGRVATSGRTSLPARKVLDQSEIHAKNRHVKEVGRIAIKAKGRILFVEAIDVVVAKAQGNYVALVHKSGCYLVRETMATAEQKLIPLGFVRVHRSILVNTTLVKDLRRDNTGTYVLRMTDGNEHPVGRAFKDNLKAIARSWLGVELV